MPCHLSCTNANRAEEFLDKICSEIETLSRILFDVSSAVFCCFLFFVFQNFLLLSFLLLIATCFEASKPLKQPWNILSPRSEDRNEESNEQLWLAMSHEQYVFSNSSAMFHKLQIYLVDRTMFQQVFQCVFVGGTLCKRLSNGSSS